MNLHDYLQAEGSLTVSALRALINVNSDAQVRQWQHGYGGRLPSPENCVAIEQATDRKVMRWDLRPEDWHRIWPELIGAEGAPAIPRDAPEGAPLPFQVPAEVTAADRGEAAGSDAAKAA